MTITGYGLVLSGLVDARCRFLRLLTGLDEQILAADRGSANVLRALRNDVVTAFQAHVEAVNGEVTAAELTSGGSDPAQWDSESLSNLAQAAVNGFLRLQQQHATVYAHLTGSRQPTDDFVFLLYRALGVAPLISRHTEMLTVHSTPNLTWETTSFAASGQTGTASIAVPWLETLAPIHWPLAVHELGHFFVPGGKDIGAERAELCQQHGWLEDDFEEIVADAVAQGYLGDAYAFALAREAYVLSYAGHVKPGVAVGRRLNLLGGPQDLLSAIPTEWGLDRRESADDVKAVEVPEVDDETAGAMRAAAVELVGTMNVNDPARVAAARALLASGEPCAGVYLEDGLPLVEQSLGPDGATKDAIAAIGAAVHVAATDGEIFEAAWREEVDRDGAAFLGFLSAPVRDEAELHGQADQLSKQDVRLARSLQSAAVHRWLIEARDAYEGEPIGEGAAL